MWRAARRSGEHSLERTLAAACPTKAGLIGAACPCHSAEALGVVVAHQANVEGVLGARTRVAPMACVGPLVAVGADCVIGPGAVLGWEGFGYSREGLTDMDAVGAGLGAWEQKDQRYGVIVGDNVHIGAGACVDRGSWRDTVIGSGTKVDNLVHVAHNVRIGEDCLVIAGAMLGGSVEVGDGSWVAPHAVVREHVKIGKGAFVALGAVVVKDVGDGEHVRGVPAKAFDPGEAGRAADAAEHGVSPRR
jgi:UDP-3-O-[3-hydroxymyristoyl] glucosamine N-acyltransferase LpxD